MAGWEGGGLSEGNGVCAGVAGEKIPICVVEAHAIMPDVGVEGRGGKKRLMPTSSAGAGSSAGNQKRARVWDGPSSRARS